MIIAVTIHLLTCSLLSAVLGLLALILSPSLTSRRLEKLISLSGLFVDGDSLKEEHPYTNHVTKTIFQRQYLTQFIKVNSILVVVMPGDVSDNLIQSNLY
jgi:hypothetical protein